MRISSVLATLLLLALLPGASCGPPPEPGDNGTRMHAQIALTIEQPLLAAHAILEARRDAEKAAARQRSETPEEYDRLVALLEQEYAPVDRAWAFTQQAHEAYITAIHAANDKDTPVTAELALALLSKWQALIAAAEAIGLEVPTIPEVFTNGVKNGPS